MSPVFWHWLILGSALIALEATVPGTFLLWPGIAAFLTGIIAYMAPGLGWELHGVFFAVLTVAVAVLGRRLYARLRQPVTDQPLLNKRGEQLIGSRHVLDDTMLNGHGRMRIGDTTWSIAGPDLPAGTKVVVTAIDGNCLRVTAARP
jgi:membrane protein implicated in regulation of membrane protease activity